MRRGDVQSYLAELSRAGLAARTAARRLSCLRQFYRFLMLESVREDDPTERQQAPKIASSLPRPLDEAEIRLLLEVGTRGHENERRDIVSRAALELLYTTGLRISELLALPATCVHVRGPMLLVRGKGDGSVWCLCPKLRARLPTSLCISIAISAVRGFFRDAIRKNL